MDYIDYTPIKKPEVMAGIILSWIIEQVEYRDVVSSSFEITDESLPVGCYWKLTLTDCGGIFTLHYQKHNDQWILIGSSDTRKIADCNIVFRIEKNCNLKNDIISSFYAIIKMIYESLQLKAE